MWKYDFFIVHAGPDKELAESLYKHLTPGFRVFLDSRTLLPGDNWEQVIPSALSQSAISLILITEKTSRAFYAKTEIRRAIMMAQNENATHRVVPIFVGDVDPKALEQPYGLDLIHAISLKDHKDLPETVHQMQAQLRPALVMSSEEIQARYKKRASLQRALRLIPRADFDPQGYLGRTVRKYVFIGDYEEQRHRTLREILSNLMIGDFFERVHDSDIEWTALTFTVGDLNASKLDLKPATWKSAFRILSHPRKVGCIEATNEDRAQMGTRPYDYYSDDQMYWYRRLQGSEFVEEMLGIYNWCFNGEGITEAYIRGSITSVPSRIFFVKNVLLRNLNYSFQEMGSPVDNCRLD